MTFMVGLCVVCLDCQPTYEIERLRLIGGEYYGVIGYQQDRGADAFTYPIDNLLPDLDMARLED